MRKLLGVMLIAVVALSVGFFIARAVYRPADEQTTLAAIYSPHTQFARSAATVIYISSQRGDKAIAINCEAMRSVVSALESVRDPSYTQNRIRLERMIERGHCPK